MLMPEHDLENTLKVRDAVTVGNHVEHFCHPLVHFKNSFCVFLRFAFKVLFR